MKSLAVHYQNKYPDANVSFDESRLDVHTVHGKHLIAIRKNGAGMVEDKSQEFGCAERHDLSPIVKESRIRKLCADGCIREDELAEDRKKLCKEKEAEFFEKKDGYKKAKCIKA